MGSVEAQYDTTATLILYQLAEDRPKDGYADDSRVQHILLAKRKQE